MYAHSLSTAPVASEYQVLSQKPGTQRDSMDQVIADDAFDSAFVSPSL